LAYDAATRLYQTSGGSAGTTRFGYDGSDLIAEYNGSNAMLRRYVHGPGTDEPLVWYEGSGTGDRRFLHSDERGSVVAVTNSSGTTLNVNGYDEHGIPSSGNAGRFQYTGQTWLPELGMYYYKARIYSPTLGRFLQPDPIGYGDGMNMYAYVGGDPVNSSDPTGTMTYDDNQSHFVDYAEEWEAQRGPNLITMAGGHSRDGMGMSDLVRMAGGRIESAGFERWQAADTRLNTIAAQTGVNKGCLLDKGCTDFVHLASGDGYNHSLRLSPNSELARAGVSDVHLSTAVYAYIYQKHGPFAIDSKGAWHTYLLASPHAFAAQALTPIMNRAQITHISNLTGSITADGSVGFTVGHPGYRQDNLDMTRTARLHFERFGTAWHIRNAYPVRKRK
jgi:RHS repeat-associated protein